MSEPTSLRAGSVERHHTPSLLDRLIDDQPSRLAHQAQEQLENTPGPANAKSPREYLFDLQTYRERLVEDLNRLVQTCRPSLDRIPSHLAEVRRSILTYGVPDITAYGTTAEDAERMANDLREAIENFEPRLRNVHVTVAMQSRLSRSIRLSVRALLLVEPAPEQIHFDASLSVMQLLKLSEHGKGTEHG